MIDFIPLEFYQYYYINTALVIVIFTMLHSWVLELDDYKNILYIKTIGYLLLILILLYIGLRPVSGRYFADMRTYSNTFEYYANGGDLKTDKDVFFQLITKFCAEIMTVNAYFLMCAVLYIVPMYRVSKAFFKEYWFYSFLMFLVSFSFWSYGVNGIRNGLATSMFLWAISFYEKKPLMIAFMILSMLFHKTLLLPILAFSLTFLHNKSKTYLIFWIAAIPLSIALGSFWESLFASLGFADDRLSGYLTNESAGRSGFRYDFLFYSSFPVIAGWFYIFKKDFQDKLYHHIFNTYLITNAFWILVIRANFSNRFAYLSWFLMGLIIIYPLLKEQFHKHQHIVIGQILVAYFSFTYLMFTIYYAR
ncbi:EpsG family protein [Tamlana agarivorans]|uniref:EpsG family protein n=1 Tax=Pseudotamlana agarivorans TaxID=481183 RepID=A0ACC5UAC4_9FLAO|nr:EpsG family protein [Tamlana agarivorans]MBU2951160.1 EpsG family protein [Tamlana agarivorans]